jgi:hypothetical protein
MGIEQKVQIQKPVGEVFSTVSNPANLPHYDDNIIEVKPSTQGVIGVGKTYQLFATQYGRRMVVDLEITAFEPNNQFALIVNSRPFLVQTHYTFVGENQNTTIIGKRVPHPEGIWRVLLPLISIPANKKFEGELNNLKNYLEQDS